MHPTCLQDTAPPAAALQEQLQSMLSELRQTRQWLNTQVEDQIQRVECLVGRLTDSPSAETAPLPSPGAVSHPLSTAPRLTSIYPAPETEKIDPELEEATLVELNQALAEAFNEIAARGGMLVKP